MKNNGNIPHCRYGSKIQFKNHRKRQNRCH